MAMMAIIRIISCLSCLDVSVAVKVAVLQRIELFLYVDCDVIFSNLLAKKSKKELLIS